METKIPDILQTDKIQNKIWSRDQNIHKDS